MICITPKKHTTMKTKHLVLSVAAIVMIILLLVFSLLTAETAAASSNGNPDRTEVQPYPVTLPTMTLVGLTAPCDGTVDGRRNTLADLWTSFGKVKAFNNDPAIYRLKIYVMFYNHSKTDNTYSIFIGYSVVNWLRNELIINNKSVMLMDFPKGNFNALDVRGTSVNGIIKSWDSLYGAYPNDDNHLGIEAYTLDSDNYSVQNVTLYLKK